MSKPIVLIHGSSESATNWQSQTDYLGPEHAIAIDLPGHGQRADTLPAEVSICTTVLLVRRCALSLMQALT